MKNTVPTIFLELCDKRNSGFVKDGTMGTAFHEELNCPNIAWIPNQSKTAVIETIDGRDTIVYKDIRWIKGCNIIDKDEQDKKGIKPSPKEDLIIFDKGFATIPKEGSTLSLYEYLEKSFYNKNNPNRPDSLEPIYQVLQLDKEAEEINEADIEMADAIKLVESLRVKTGNKDIPYKYNEDRIKSLCDICQVHADSPAQQLKVLMQLAKYRSRWFLNLAVKFEQTILTEIAHALELKVIMFEGNTTIYCEDGKVIRNFGAGNYKHERKIELFADYLKSREGTEALTELRTKVDVAKDKLLN